MSQVAMLRIAILAVGIVIIVVVYWTGRPKKPHSRRRKPVEESMERREPVFTPPDPASVEQQTPSFSPLPSFSPMTAAADEIPTGQDAHVGKRPRQDFDKIVALFVAAKEGEMLRGEDIVVAAEKTGLVYGHLKVFHRLMDQSPERGPIFTMANLLKPGTFEMDAMRQLQTPALAFFLTLPAPVGALDAWETMLPTVQRMAELLGGAVLDDQRNPLGRQHIALIRDDLRAYDRQHAAQRTMQQADSLHSSR